MLANIVIFPQTLTFSFTFFFNEILNFKNKSIRIVPSINIVWRNALPSAERQAISWNNPD